MVSKREIDQEIELAQMMVADIDKVYKKYAKAALQAQEERLEKIRTEKYMECDTAEQLHELYGWGSVTLDEYEAGRDFFESREDRKKRLSFVEAHRKNLKEIRDRWKGTVIELQRELDEMNGVVEDKRTYVEKLEAEERAERYAALR